MEADTSRNLLPSMDEAALLSYLETKEIGAGPAGTRKPYAGIKWQTLLERMPSLQKLEEKVVSHCRSKVEVTELAEAESGAMPKLHILQTRDDLRTTLGQFFRFADDMMERKLSAEGSEEQENPSPGEQGSVEAVGAPMEALLDPNTVKGFLEMYRLSGASPSSCRNKAQHLRQVLRWLSSFRALQPQTATLQLLTEYIAAFAKTQKRLYLRRGPAVPNEDTLRQQGKFFQSDAQEKEFLEWGLKQWKALRKADACLESASGKASFLQVISRIRQG